MSPVAKVLVIEDDPIVVSALKLLLKSHELEFYPSLPAYFKKYGDQKLDKDLVLLDLCHEGDPEGKQTLQLFPELKHNVPNAEIVIQSGLKDIDIMRRCLQLGAEKFVLKDNIADEIPVFISHCLDRRKLRQELDSVMVGESPGVSDLKNRLLDLRKQHNSVDVLIEGETGCGKELCAKALHREGPFIGVNVAAIHGDLFEAELFGAEKGAYTGSSGSREGYLESVENGVLFLDEIQSLPLAQQAKLLRVLETRTYFRVGSTQERIFKGRIVSASNQPLLERVKKGHFREDLYFRLATTQVSVPPLRTRGDDITMLAKYFLKQFSEKQNIQLTPEALQYLQKSYDWPGNVRELRSVLRRLVVESKMPFIGVPEVESFIKKSELSTFPQNAGGSSRFEPDSNLSFDENVTLFEKHLISSALNGKSTIQARDALKLSRSRFYEKLKQYGLHSRND